MSDKSTTVRILRALAPRLCAVAPNLAARLFEQLFILPSRHAAPQREAAWIDGATRSMVRFDDRRSLAVYAWGEGPTVLLVHGWAGRGSQLAVYARPLVARGFRVVAFDAPAHGRSAGRRTALPEFATAVQRVAAEVGPLHGIVGHSIGTAAITVALSRGVEVERLVYLSPPERPGEYLRRAAQWLGFSEQVTEATLRRLERRYDVLFADADGPRLAADLEQPLLVIHDREDREVPFHEGVALADAWPNSRLQPTDGLGHTRIIRDDAVVRSVVAFMAESSPRQVAV